MHHAHACEVNCCSEPAATAEGCFCASHHSVGDADFGQTRHGLSDGALSGGGHELPQHRCEGDLCTFVWSGQSPEQLGELRLDLCPLELAVSLHEADRIPANFGGGRELSDCGDGPPLRVHLLFSVLLI